MNNESNNKFNFVSMDDLENITEEFNNSKNIEKTKSNDSNVLKFQYNDNNSKKNTNNNIENNSNNNKVKNKLHLTFEARVSLLIILVLLLFIGSIFAFLKTINYGKNKTVKYTESSNINYNVCLRPTDATDIARCIANKSEYKGELIDTIRVEMNYKAKVSEVINYNHSYHMDLIYRRYDATTSDIKDEFTEHLGDTKKTNQKSDTVSIHSEVVFDYQKYNQMIINYRNEYKKDDKGDLTLVLYLDDIKGFNQVESTYEVASITMPLGEEIVPITNTILSDGTIRNVEVHDNTWDNNNTIYVTITAAFVLISLILIYKTVGLVAKVIKNRNKYQEKLSQILMEYDRIIVVARDGYVSSLNRQIEKVASFDELLEIKKNLSKPIIYSRVNDVKSEFIVEDSKKVYKFVLKDTDC